MERERKDALRASALAARRAMRSDERHDASRSVVDRLRALPELRLAAVVLVYAALSEETDVTALIAPLHRRGTRTLLPRVRGDRLELVASADTRILQAGYRGIREPVGPAVDPGSVDVVVIPGVAFDPHGGRLGQGGGHYDRLLPSLPVEAVRIGVCFACQFVPVVPREEHDALVDLVVTERVVHRTGARP